MQRTYEQRSPEGNGSTGGGLPPLGSGPNVFRPGSPGIGTPGASQGPAPSTPALPPDAQEVRPKIQNLEQRLGAGGRSEDHWKRSSNKTGVGATHVKTFHAKLTGDSLEFLDKQINDWLDSHPDHEVKFSTSTVGEWTGKLKEPNLIIQVWV